MKYLIDTNVLLRFTHAKSEHHLQVRNAVATLKQVGHDLIVSNQNFIEFWNVATRPINYNGLGLSTVDADYSLQLMETLFKLLPQTESVYPEWRRLVTLYSVAGVKVHDAHLAAVMKAHSIPYILTFNTIDFDRFQPEGISAVHPSDILR